MKKLKKGIGILMSLLLTSKCFSWAFSKFSTGTSSNKKRKTERLAILLLANFRKDCRKKWSGKTARQGDR
jgi:hypothetical protein